MSREGRYLLCSKKYGQPLFAGAWVTPLKESKEKGEEEGGVVVLAGGGGNQRSGVPNSLILVDYDFATTVLTDALDKLATGDDPPFRLAARPGGEGVLLCSFEKDCKLFQVRRGEGGEGEGGKMTVAAAAEERGEVAALQGVGEQNCLVFSPDGSRVAAGGDDGYLRVIDWASFNVLLDKPEAHKSIKDLDFSLDGALLASTSDDSACRIWDVESGSCVSTLPAVKGEGMGFVRFSRDGSRPNVLYVAVRKRGMGFVSAFDTSTWKLVNSRKVQEDPISAFAISRDGRFLAIGSSEGDLSIVDTASLTVCQKLKGAHMIFVTSMEFSPSGRAVLSVSADSSARVTPVSPSRGGGSGRRALFVFVCVLLLAWFLGNSDSTGFHSLPPESLLARLISFSKLNITDHAP